LMTIGYETLSPDQLCDLLAQCKVSLLLDIRELPISRKRGFAKSALAATLEKRRIGYLHLPELGSPRDVRHGYREDGDWARYTRGFLEYLDTQSAAVERVASLAKQQTCCLFCYEDDYHFCHRSFVAERVARATGKTVRVWHITGPIEGRVVRYEALVPEAGTQSLR
jgi:uncharacterized protein (DUF488 family)